MSKKRKRFNFDDLPPRKKNWYHDICKNAPINFSKREDKYFQLAADEIGTTKERVIHVMKHMKRKNLESGVSMEIDSDEDQNEISNLHVFQNYLLNLDTDGNFWKGCGSFCETTEPRIVCTKCTVFGFHEKCLKEKYGFKQEKLLKISKLGIFVCPHCE